MEAFQYPTRLGRCREAAAPFYALARREKKGDGAARRPLAVQLTGTKIFSSGLT